ncbi:hypothetical protein [Cryptosporangium minutisporangium]|uniref:DUF732 domain-containing protein n=1 Tax=Cryptosporangium minutisporangium TaxID=113569 RepID=A0ABP6T3N3_9ACTN
MTSDRRLAVFLTLILGAAVASGCSSTAADPPSADPQSAAPAASGAYSAKDVCAYLEGEIPALKEIGSPVGRHANLAGKLATFFEAHGKPENGAVLDAATKAECPTVRTEVLALMDVDSFSSF